MWFSVVYLTNRMWFNVVYSFIDNDTRHHSGQNVVDSRGAASHGKNISDTFGYASCATFLFLSHFDVICDLLLNRRTATWNLFDKSTTIRVITVVKICCENPSRCVQLSRQR